MRSWRYPQWIVASLGAVATALLVGLPTLMIPNPWFSRMIEAEWWNRPVWIVTSVLAGLIVATYVGVRDEEATEDELDEELRSTRRGGAGGVLTFFAVGCPICNKLVVLALGTTGALEWFAPAQPILAAASIALLAVALRSRLRAATSCPTTLREALGLSRRLEAG